MALGVARPLPTRANRQPQQQQPPSSPTSTIHKCKLRPTNTSHPLNLPNYEIELYWRKECQWWHMDRKTILHDFQYKEEYSGYCVASWGVRKRVRCCWRRVSEENDSEGAPSSSEEEDDGSSLERATAAAAATTTTTEVSIGNDDEDLSASATQRSNTDLEDDNNDEEDAEQDDDDIDANWWDYSSDDEDDSSDEDYTTTTNTTQSPTKKRARRMHPCDATTATFGTTIITKGGIYERYNEGKEDRWIIQILGFAGKNFPIRKARCRIIFHMHSAVQECFPNAVVASAKRSRSDDGGEGGGIGPVQIDRSIVMEETIKGTEFLQTLVASEEDFDVLSRLVEFDLKRDRSNKLIAQFSLRRLCNSPLAAAAEGHPLRAENDQVTTNPKPKELVLFAGIGGCSIGDEEAGFDCKWLVDKDHLAAASLRQCHPHATIYDEDVGAFLDKCTEQRPGYPKRGDVDHIQCSSPCNGFSRMNIYGGRNDHKNNILCHELVRATEIFLPKTGMFENVTGLLDASNVHHIIKIVQDLIRLKFQVRVAVLNSIDYGVPQKRKRVILTMARADMPLPGTPSPTHIGGSFATLGDAIHDMNDIECEMERHRSGLVQLPNGNFTFNHVARVARKDSKALDLEEPVACITTQNSFKHPLTVTNRTLSIREYARLFGFPDAVQLFGSYTEIRKHIGNSVPVPLARAISIPIRLVHGQGSTTSTTGTES